MNKAYVVIDGEFFEPLWKDTSDEWSMHAAWIMTKAWQPVAEAMREMVVEGTKMLKEHIPQWKR